MRNKESQTKVRKIGFIVPITVYLLCVAISYFSSYMILRVIYPWASLSDLWMSMQFINPLMLILSYSVSHFYTKKKAWGYWGFPFLIAAVMLYAYILIGNLIVALYSGFMILDNLAVGVLLYMSYDWFRKVRKQKELEQQNLQSELKLLKNQLSPHFLFNTLNNIDSLIHSNSSKASEALVQMSEMMRYMIYETNVHEVSLSQELTHIENYLNLQKLQYDNPHLVSYSVEGNPDGIHIAPMLFIPFVENTFKHCTDKKEKEAICFRFLIHESEVCFEASNLFDKSKLINKDSASGIGLNVVKRRLDFLYPDKHDLQIKQENGYFCVSLKIKLI